MTSDLTTTYRVRQLTDRGYSLSQQKAGGDVLSATVDAMKHLMRQLSDLPPGSGSLLLRFVYNPEANTRDPRDRLSIGLASRAHRPEQGASLSLMLTGSRLQNFHDLAPAPLPPVDWSSFRAVCEVVRRQTILPATVTAEFNPKALEAYWMITPFEPDPQNDYMQLDAGMGLLNGPAVLDICMTSVGMRELLVSHTQYIALLQQISRTRDWEEDDGLTSSFELGPWAAAGKPLRRTDPVVEHVLQHQQGFHSTLTQSHLAFTIRAYAGSTESARGLGSLAAEAAFKDGSYQLVDLWPRDGSIEHAIEGARNLSVEPLPVLGDLVHHMNPEVLRDLVSMANTATIDELSGAFRLPVAGRVSPCCIRKNTDPPPMATENSIVLGYDLQQGERLGVNPVALGIPLELLCSHLFISGKIGSGKTLAALNLLGELGRYQVPFMVIEAGQKTEYRQIKLLVDHPVDHVRRLAENLQVYSPGDEGVSPFRHNPLSRRAGVPLNESVEALAGCFQAAFPMTGPLLPLLAEASERTHDDHPADDAPPRMADLVKAVHAVLATKGYSPEVNSDIRAALEVRLGVLTRRSVGRVFQCPHDIPSIERLLSGQSVIELSSLPPDQACLLTLFILNAISQRIKSTPWSGQGVRLVILLEEAHNIVGRDTNAVASEGNANPRAHAAAKVSRMLTELRALGVGMVILDQSPSAVAEEVVKNTATKLAFCHLGGEDRRFIGDSMLFGPAEDEQDARLPRGVAYLFTEGYSTPRLIRTPDIRSEWRLPRAPVGKAILPHLERDVWFIEAANARVGEETDLLRQAMNDMEGRCRPLIDQGMGLVRNRIAILQEVPAKDRAIRLHELARCAVSVRDRLACALRDFRREVYKPLIGEDPPPGVVQESLNNQRNQLIDRFSKVITPSVTACVAVLGKLIRQCGAP